MLLLAFSLASLVAISRGQCRGKVDVAIAIPAGAVVDPLDFQAFEENLINLLSLWKVEGRQDFSVGLIIYGDTTKDIATPLPFKNRLQLNTRVTILSRLALHALEIGTGNDVAKAIDRIRTMLTSRDRPINRPSARKFGIIFTYGPAETPFEYNEIRTASFKAQEAGITMFVVNANGTGPERHHMTQHECRMFVMDTYANNLEQEIPRIGKSVCAALDPSVIVRFDNCIPRDYTPVTPRAVVCLPSDVLIPDPNNCAYFYNCHHGKAIRQVCSHNTIFDRQIQNCNFKGNVACYANLNLTCPEPTGQFEHPTHCNKYLNCFDGIAHVMDCPYHNWFDAHHPLGKQCVPRRMTYCPSFKIRET